MRRHNMKKTYTKRNEFEAPVQRDVISVSMRGATESRGGERSGREGECTPTCVVHA
jgi:hypothetical protein